MDVPIVSTPTQVILVSTLLGLLLTWLVTFTVLALRAQPLEKALRDDQSTPSGSFPAISIQTSRPIPVPSSAGLHITGRQPGTVNIQAPRDR